jgi:hypothetical protein
MMNKISRNLNIILGTALFFAAFLTWLGPKIIQLILTPPVSFGVNCEPAAAYSMHKLILVQASGLILGALASLIYVLSRKPSNSSKGSAENPPKNPPDNR